MKILKYVIALTIFGLLGLILKVTFIDVVIYEIALIILIAALDAIPDDKILLWLKLKICYRNRCIRLSISYLFKIKIDDKYLLLKGNRIKDQFQPVGGVYKRYSASNYLFNKFNVHDDEYMAIDDISKDDLRIMLDDKHAFELIKWFESQEFREISPTREFYEELIKTKILEAEDFCYYHYEFKKRVQTKIKFSYYFGCHEILIADIYEFIPNEVQKKKLKQLQLKTSSDYIWVDAEIIKKLGFNKEESIRISESSKWIL